MRAIARLFLGHTTRQFGDERLSRRAGRVAICPPGGASDAPRARSDARSRPKPPKEPRPWRLRGVPTPVRYRSSSPRLQPAAWIEHPLAHIPMAAHPHPTRTARLVLVRERPLHQFTPPALKTTDRGLHEYADGPQTTPAAQYTLLRRRLPGLLVLPAAPTAVRLRDVAANPNLVERHQRRVAVVPLVGHHLFDLPVVLLHRLNLLRRHRQRRRQRRRITLRRHDGHAKIGQVRQEPADRRRQTADPRIHKVYATLYTPPGQRRVLGAA